MAKRIDKKALLVGGLNFRTGNCKPLAVSKTAPADSISESNQQKAFFTVLALNEPKPPTVQRRSARAGRILVEENRLDPGYLNHKFYVLTRVRHFPNGGLRHTSVALSLKEEGVRPGAFDIQLDAARRGFHGLRIEMKAHDGALSPQQVEERAWLEKEGYSVHVCWHYVEALEVVMWYCGIERRELRGYPSRHAVSLPAKGHDALCGCSLKLDLRELFPPRGSAGGGATLVGAG